MKLVDLLAQELPKRGGWPEGALSITQDSDGSLCVWGTNDPHYDGFSWKHHTGNSLVCYWHGEVAIPLSFDYKESIATYWQYKEALAASKAVVGHDGWIQWAGGDCPVDSDAIVEVKYRNPNQYQFNSDRAGDFYWSHDGLGYDIIAYRPWLRSRANDERLEQDLNECIGQDVDMPEWNGEGFPPVGTICEYSLAGRVWSPCKVELHVGTQGVVISCDVFEGIQYVDFAKYDDFEFRPLRTEAEKLRDEAGLALYHAINWNAEGEMVSPSRMEDYKKAYDAIAAGKIPGVKLEEK